MINHTHVRNCSSLGAAALALTTAAHAQVIVPATDADQTYNSIAMFSNFGESVLITDDFDNDGWRDIMVGVLGLDVPDDRGATMVNAGGVILYSAQTGAVLRVYPGIQAESTTGFDTVELPDRNGDGVVDFAVGAPRLDDNGQADVGGFVIYSGADAAVLDSVYGTLGANAQLGWSLRAIGDITGDGVTELAAGAPTAGSAVIYDGDTLMEINTVSEPQANAGFGWSVEAAGDVNNDGTPDFIVGAPFYDTMNINPNPDFGGADEILTDSGRAVVYSGSDFAELHIFERHDTSVAHEVFSPFQNFGTRVATVGDINDDGHDDVIVGAPETSQGSGGAGHVMVFSGIDGSVIYDIDGPQIPGEKHGERVLGLGDVDGDGVNDFAASSNQSCFDFPGCGRAGSVIAYSGATGQPIMQYNGELSNDTFGGAMVAGDVNEDGGTDLVIAALFHSTSTNSPGQAYLFLGDPVAMPGDLNGDGNVDVFDLLDLLANWGADAAGADLAEPSDVVDVFDLLELLSLWGS